MEVKNELGLGIKIGPDFLLACPIWFPTVVKSIQKLSLGVFLFMCSLE